MVFFSCCFSQGSSGDSGEAALGHSSGLHLARGRFENTTRGLQVLPEKPKWSGWSASFTFVIANLVFYEN